MSDFMEAFTVTHLTYAVITPCFGAMIALVLHAVGNLSNAFLCLFAILFLFVLGGRVIDTLETVPYFDDRMEQFNDGDPVLKSLSQ